MSFGERLIYAREQAGLNQRQLAERLNITPTRLNYWEKDKRQPDVLMIKTISDVLSISADYLIGNTKKSPAISAEAQKLARDYDQLDAHGQRVLRSLADEELARMQAEQEVEEPATKVIPLFANSFAAGSPEPDFGNAWEQYEISAADPADFAIRIHGDSMEPFLPDGSIAFGRRIAPNDGDVGAFLLDGEFICKQFCQDAPGNIYLFSLNRDRRDADVTIPHDSGRDLRYFGTVIMKNRVPLPVD